MPVTVVTPDSKVQSSAGVRVFLAGTIDLGNSEDWQLTLIGHLDELTDIPVVVLNPRRDTWHGTPTTDNPEFVKQVSWEMKNLESADIIVMRLIGSSRSPVSLMELGLHARIGKLIVLCDDGFWRKGNVDMVSERYGIKQVSSPAALLDEVLDRIEKHHAT